MLVTWAFGVVPSGLSFRGPDMSLDMRLLTVSFETADSDGPGQDSRVRLPSLGGHEMPAAKCSVFARGFR